MSKKLQKKIRPSFSTKDITETVLNDGLGNPLYEQFCIENKRIDKDNYKITLQSLEKLWQQALNINKKPCLVLGLRRDNNEIFLLQCFLTIKKNKKGR